MPKLLAKLAFFGAVYFVLWYFFGTTTVTATADGKPIHAVVKIDGKRVGRTPYSDRLGFGQFSIEVFPPKYGEWRESVYTASLWSVVIGQDVKINFHHQED